MLGQTERPHDKLTTQRLRDRLYWHTYKILDKSKLKRRRNDKGKKCGGENDEDELNENVIEKSLAG